MTDSKAKVCVHCGGHARKSRRPEYARGLCPSCYDHFRNIGELEQFPRTLWRAEDLVAEADLLLSHGATKADTAKRLGVKWDSITRARLRLKRSGVELADAMVYTEHIKLEKIARLSHSIGEFIEWLGTESVHLMRWTVTTDIRTCQGTLMRDCRGLNCTACNGANIVEVKDERWLPHGMSIPDMLAKFFDIDQARLETEKRHMLETLRNQHKE